MTDSAFLWLSAAPPAIVGAYKEDTGATDAGAAYIFERNGDGSWNATETQKIQASDKAESDYFGNSVAISGTTAIVGAYYEDMGDTNDYAGTAYIFEKDGSTGNWSHVKKITPSSRVSGERFGYKMAIDGNYFIVGTYTGDTSYIFERDGAGNWGDTETHKILGEGNYTSRATVAINGTHRYCRE